MAAVPGRPPPRRFHAIRMRTHLDDASGPPNLSCQMRPSVLGKHRADRSFGSIGKASPHKRRRVMEVRLERPPPKEPEKTTESADAPKRTLRGKKKDNDMHECYVVQIGLESLCFSEETMAVIENLVRRASQIAFETSKLCILFFHVVVEQEWRLRMAAIGSGVHSDCALPEIDRTFFDRVMSLVSSLKNPALPDDRVENEELKLPFWAQNATARSAAARVSPPDDKRPSSSALSNPHARPQPNSSTATVPNGQTFQLQPQPTSLATTQPKPQTKSTPKLPKLPKPRPNSAASVQASSKVPCERAAGVEHHAQPPATAPSTTAQPKAPVVAKSCARSVAHKDMSATAGDSANTSTAKPKKKIKVVTYEQDLLRCAALYKRLRKSSDTPLWASRLYLGDVLREVNMQLVTNFQNHVTTNFEAHTRRFLHIVIEEDAPAKKLRQQCVDAMYVAITKNGVISFPAGVRPCSALHTTMQREVELVRHIIGHQQLPVTESKLERRWVHYLPWFYHIMVHIDRLNVDRKVRGQTLLRSLTLVPDRGLTPVSIAITPTVLRRNLLPMHWMHDGQDTLDKKVYDRDEIWNCVFRFKAIHGFKKRTFDDRIMTDGVRCSVLFKRPLPPELRGMSPTKRKELADAKMTAKGGVVPPRSKTRVVGLDPGGRDLFVAVVQAPEPSNATNTAPSGQTKSRIIRMSTAEYYSIAGFTAARRKRESRLDLNPAIREIESKMPTTKTSSFEGIQWHVRHVLTHFGTLMDYYHDPWHRRLAWKSVRGKQKAIHQACVRIAGKTAEERSKTAVGFGDGMFSDLSYKGHAKGPVKTLFKELRKYCHVDPICEFRTSKLCHQCQLPVKEVLRSDKERNPPPQKTACERYFGRQTAKAALRSTTLATRSPSQVAYSKDAKDAKDGLRLEVADAFAIRTKRWDKRKECLAAGRAIFGVRVCTTRECAGESGAIHRNRDVNAAKNILWLYKHGRTFRSPNDPSRGDRP